MKGAWNKCPEIFCFFFLIKIIITFEFHISIFYIAYEKQKFLSATCFAETKIFVASEGKNISYRRTQKSFEIYHCRLSFQTTGVFIITTM
jgi:hypothetical protein